MNINLSKQFYNYSKLPKNWKEKKLKYVIGFSEKTSDSFKNDKKLSLTKNGIIIKNTDSNQGQIAESYEKYISVEKNQICMNPMDLLSGWVDISKYQGLISPAYYTLDVKKEFDTKFINYFLQSNYLRKTFFKLGKGIASHDNLGRWVLTSEELKNVVIFLPELREQKLISQYLDKKIEQINSLKKKYEKKILFLKEELLILINNSVTKGLKINQDLKYVNSKFLKKIPNSWNFLKLSNIGIFSKGKNITKNDLQINGNQVILYSHIYTYYDRYVEKADFFISEQKNNESVKIKKGDFLFTSSGETVEEIGKTIVYNGNLEIAVGGDLVIFKFKDTNKYDPEFFSFLFNSKFVQDQKSSNSRGEIVVHIYEKQLRDLRICFPKDINEQKEISLMLKNKEKKCNQLIDRYKKKITLLNEYLKTTISSTIMGKNLVN